MPKPSSVFSPMATRYLAPRGSGESGNLMGIGSDYLQLGQLQVYDRFDADNITMEDESSIDGNDEINMSNVAFAASINILMGKVLTNVKCETFRFESIFRLIPDLETMK